MVATGPPWSPRDELTLCPHSYIFSRSYCPSHMMKDSFHAPTFGSSSSLNVLHVLLGGEESRE